MFANGNIKVQADTRFLSWQGIHVEPIEILSMPRHCPVAFSLEI
jgi:hypothetical protein